MTLARTALRLATVNALIGADAATGPTLAHNRVYDSRINDFSPETYPADALPAIIILTDEDDGEALSRQNGGPPFKRMIKLVFEFAMVQSVEFAVPDPETGNTTIEFAPAHPATDAEHEASLDLLEYQIKQRLASGLDPASLLWQRWTRVWKSDCHRQVMDQSGVKIAARVLTWDCEITDDQLQVYNASDAIPTGFDIFPEPMRSVAKSLTPGTERYQVVVALAAALSPITAPALDGIDFTFDTPNDQESVDMLGVTMELRTAFETPQVIASGASVTLDYAKGASQQLILAANVTSISVTNWPPQGKPGRLILQITNTGTYSVTGWSNTEWAGGVAPNVTQGAGKKDIVVLTTMSAGVEVFGNIIGQDYS